MVFSVFLSLLAVLLVGLLLLLPFVVRFSRPPTAKTVLTSAQYQNYYRILRAVAAHPGGPLELKIPLEEGSYLLERHLPGLQLYRFQLTDVQLRSAANGASLKVVARGPAGLYYPVDFVGNLRWQAGEWEINAETVKLGKIPAGALLYLARFPVIPESLFDGGVVLQEIVVDATGISLKLESDGALLDWPGRW